MKCLNISPEKVLKKCINDNISNRNYSNYNFMDNLNEYDIPVNIYYNYILSINEYRLKNIYNHIIFRWNKMLNDFNEELLKNKKYHKYIEIKYNQIHKQLSVKELNDLLNDFNTDLLKSVFIINSIQNYINPI